ncbi:unnamed protein product [Withania somnifera]
MVKRKRSADLNKTPNPTDQLPPPGMDALSKQAMCYKHPCNYYGRYYSRRRSVNNAEASASCGGTAALYEGKMFVKPASKCNSGSGHDTESRQSELHKPERVDAAPSLLATNATSSNVKKPFCRLCQKSLRKKHYILDSSISSSEPSVVAVLVCGHLYHADCLEDRTHHEDITDPPCPICGGIN